ncbi:hypothetical protein [Nocardia sp. NBC_00403]|uniref:hypothetical protein n=1 Tax=Nocardia sp. NBC_00403 TaxID=2975990 RepID=UPI002E1F7728
MNASLVALGRGTCGDLVMSLSEWGGRLGDDSVIEVVHRVRVCGVVRWPHHPSPGGEVTTSGETAVQVLKEVR